MRPLDPAHPDPEGYPQSGWKPEAVENLKSLALVFYLSELALCNEVIVNQSFVISM